jgi:hypothetical protein
MKRNRVFPSIAAVFILMATFAVAGAGRSMRIIVPFDFYLEDQLVPAGEYRFEMPFAYSSTASSVTVRSADGKGIRMLATMPATGSISSTNQLVFNKYGEKYFLSSISISGHRAGLKTFGVEKELKSQIEKAQKTTTIAS